MIVEKHGGMTMSEELAKITGFRFGREDHGIMTMYLDFDYGGTMQSFGGYCIDTFDEKKDRRVGSAAGMDYVMKILDTLDCMDISELKGKMCFAIKEGEKYSSKVIGIKQIPQDGDGKFLISDWQKEWFPGQEDKF